MAETVSQAEVEKSPRTFPRCRRRQGEFRCPEEVVATITVGGPTTAHPGVDVPLARLLQLARADQSLLLPLERRPACSRKFGRTPRGNADKELLELLLLPLLLRLARGLGWAREVPRDKTVEGTAASLSGNAGVPCAASPLLEHQRVTGVDQV